MMYVNEIFRSIQGESTRSGLSCLFIRLQGCNLECSFCDTPAAGIRQSGSEMTIDEIVQRAVRGEPSAMIEVTGGEPLLQPETPVLLERLAKTATVPVLLETNGSIRLPGGRSYTVVMDFKCPGSGESESREAANSDLLKHGDEVKFVITGRDDFDWMLARLDENAFHRRGIEVLVVPAAGICSLPVLADWVLAAGLPLRLQPQLHKIIGCR